MTILIFILILSVLVFVHELGHFIAAKRAGILVEEFGFGLPPRIWGKKIGETLYSINALPIGGFVKLYGEDGEAGRSKGAEVQRYSGRAYYEKSIFRRLTVLLAGVSMNLLLAIVAFSIIYFVVGIPTKSGKVIVQGTSDNSPAKISGLKEGDQIVRFDEKNVISNDQFSAIAKEKAGNKVKIEILREPENPCGSGKEDVNSPVLGGMTSFEKPFSCNGKNIILYVIPREKPPEGEGPLGVAIGDTELKKYPFWQMPYYGVREGFKESLSWGGMILSALKNMVVTLVVNGQVPKDIAGPIGIFQITSQATKAGYLAVFQFLGILSVNLAIINILPFPALDGGRIVFLGYEFIFRKKVNPKFEALTNNLGMAFLLGLMLLITVNDVLRLLNK